MVNKISKDRRMVNKNRKRQDISSRTIEATESVRSLIHSIILPLEEKIAMEDQINNLSHENSCLLDLITNSDMDHQEKLFLAYREYLKCSINDIDQLINGM